MPITPDARRCRWAETSPLLRTYHDEEWGVAVHDSRELWEMLCLEGFQAGLSWLTVLKRRDAFRKAFKGFNPEIVACFTEADITRLMADPGIIRARAKIEATIGNAHAFLSMRENGEDFASFTWAFARNHSPDGLPIRNTTGTVLAQSPLSSALSKALKARGFKFTGPVIVYAWMQAAGMIDDHDPHCFRHQAGNTSR
ncbi:DNA-3-methyladenine glycosylase I [Acetobacter fallax]|uniref:DNA-3-methyladenine glycosylase I n=1 Tax=Acetobacter fallax TaxID=1737473 RepID=A0ABX0K976_9PROT|nr:DNA-3-methyladenine glycosylase I [Acetobacter fallax]NHO31758.1 DNA-3-methyladenine glycosylase I [Acetobacter fallax]NHO35317.1 DNA-3-methyladenine glycosylase I [Acetobacter fallax]